MRKKKSFLLVLLLILSLLVSSCASNQPKEEHKNEPIPKEETQPHSNKIITSASDPWAPFADPDHPEQGVVIHLVKAAFESQGYTLQHEFMPWSRAWVHMLSGDIDVVPQTWYTQERAEKVLFSDAILHSQLKFIMLKGKDFEYTGIDSLRGKTIGTVIDYGYTDAFIQATHFERHENCSFLANLKMLKNHRIDLVVEDSLVASYSLWQEAPELIAELEFLQEPLSTNPLYLVSSFENPRHQEMITAFNKGLAEIKANGTYDKILSELRPYGKDFPPL